MPWRWELKQQKGVELSNSKWVFKEVGFWGVIVPNIVYAFAQLQTPLLNHSGMILKGPSLINLCEAIPGQVAGFPCGLSCLFAWITVCLWGRQWRAQSFPWWKLLAKALQPRRRIWDLLPGKLIRVFSCLRTEHTMWLEVLIEFPMCSYVFHIPHFKVKFDKR